MINSENKNFLPVVPFEDKHPDMLIAAYVPTETETFGSSEYALNTECWD